jgi:methionine-rich copper-binding protein CopC
MDLRRRAGVSAAALLLVLAWASPALAAPQRLSADPEPGAELHEPPAQIELSFSEPLDDDSEIKVFDECERRLDDGTTQVSLNEMSVALELGPTGVYTVVHRAVGVTGATNEAYEFTVLHGGRSCDGGGGHGGHGGHGGDGDDDGDGSGGHGGHDGGDGGGGGSGGHGGHDGDDGTDHSTMDHSGDDHDGSDHGDGAHGGGKHGGKNSGKHGDHKKPNKPTGGGGVPPQAAGDDPAIPQPGAAALFGALGLATLFGVLGGWVLRVSGPS